MSGSKFSRSDRTVRSGFQNLGSTTERPKEMDIVNDPKGCLQNMILVTKKIGGREREREREREETNNNKKCSKPTKTLKLKWPPLIINTLKYFT